MAPSAEVTNRAQGVVDPAPPGGRKISVGSSQVAAALEAFLEGEPLTVQMVAKRIASSEPTARNVCAYLSAAGLIIQRPDDHQRATSWVLNANKGDVVVVHIAHSEVLVHRCDLLGRRLGESAVVPLDVASTDPLQAMAEARKAALALPGLRRELVYAVAICIAAPVDPVSGVVIDPPTLRNWHQEDPATIAASWFPESPLRRPAGDKRSLSGRCPVFVVNDALAVTYGCYLEGAEQGDRPSTLLGVEYSSGIGAGIVRGGVPELTAAGDLGHTVADLSLASELPAISERIQQAVDHSVQAARDAAAQRGAEATPEELADAERAGHRGPRCRCDRQRGCLSTFASGWALRQGLGMAEGSDITPVVQLLREGDPQAVELAREAGQLLGASMATIVSLLTPDRIILAGDLVLGGDGAVSLGRDVEAAIQDRALRRATRRLTITEHPGSADAAARGASIMALRHCVSEGLLPVSAG